MSSRLGRRPIHLVAERDCHTVADWTRVDVARNVVEQIRPAMNVADNINSRPIGCEMSMDADVLNVFHLDVAAAMTVFRSLPWFDRNQS
jgi:hypothetical protein